MLDATKLTCLNSFDGTRYFVDYQLIRCVLTAFVLGQPPAWAPITADRSTIRFSWLAFSYFRIMHHTVDIAHSDPKISGSVKPNGFDCIGYNEAESQRPAHLRNIGSRSDAADFAERTSFASVL